MKGQLPMAQSKILVYDIETTPSLGWVWGKYQQDVIEFKEEWHLLCFAYKWLGEEETHVVSLPQFPQYATDPENDFYVVAKLWSLFNEADVVIAHNGNKFDQRKAHARFIIHGFEPPAPYKQIDTLLTAKRYFGFNSNKLDDLGEVLGVGRKVKTGGFDLWHGCMQGNTDAWAKMEEYNKQDVSLLENVYIKLRPWMDNHPGRNIMEGKLDACPKCGENTLVKRGIRFNKSTTSQRYKCVSCGGWCHSRKSTNSLPLVVN
jgi:DNA polymerase III, epsilon subunit and related 3'-5' exonucleases